MCELGTLTIPAQSCDSLDFYYTASQIAKDFLPAVTKRDKGSFVDRVSLFLTKQSMSRRHLLLFLGQKTTRNLVEYLEVLCPKGERGYGLYRQSSVAWGILQCLRTSSPKINNTTLPGSTEGTL